MQSLILEKGTVAIILRKDMIFQKIVLKNFTFIKKKDRRKKGQGGREGGRRKVLHIDVIFFTKG